MTVQPADRRVLTERDWIALISVIILVAALVGSAAWLELRAKAEREAKAREAAVAVQAGLPKPAPPITTSVFVRAIPVRHAQ